MQFIENSFQGLRAACYRLRSADGRPEVCLFPMIHIGSLEYYAEVRRRLEDCDLVLFEGVRSPRVQVLTKAYSIVARKKRLGLISQREALATPLQQQRKIHADVSSEEFDVSWKRIPWAERVLLLVGAPLFGLWMYLTANRERIGRRMNMDDLESRNDIEQAEASPELTEAIMSSRDEHLVEQISSALAEGSTYKRIGILYGAAHMRAVVRLLDGKYGYKVAGAEWITVLDYGER